MQSYRSAWLQGSYTGNGGGAGAATWLLRATGCSSFGRQSKHVGHLVESGWACPLSNQRWREEVLAGYPPPPVCHILERTYWAECFTSFAKWEAGRQGAPKSADLDLAPFPISCARAGLAPLCPSLRWCVYMQTLSWTHSVFRLIKLNMASEIQNWIRQCFVCFCRVLRSSSPVSFLFLKVFSGDY